MTLNLSNIAYKKCLLFQLRRHQKCLINLTSFRNTHHFYPKHTSNDLINRSLLKNSKLLIDWRKYPNTPSMVCLMSSQPIDELTYERIADQTLDHLNEKLEIILEESTDFKDADISLSVTYYSFNSINQNRFC